MSCTPYIETTTPVTWNSIPVLLFNGRIVENIEELLDYWKKASSEKKGQTKPPKLSIQTFTRSKITYFYRKKGKVYQMLS